MTETNHWRGWPIYWDGKYWRYKDTGDCVRAVDRPCGICGKERTPEGHDACLGELPGVSNACCGHGSDREAYVQFDTGARLSGSAAVVAFAGLRASAAIRRFGEVVGSISIWK